jgi:hypothetical protein
MLSADSMLSTDNIMLSTENMLPENMLVDMLSDNMMLSDNLLSYFFFLGNFTHSE